MRQNRRDFRRTGGWFGYDGNGVSVHLARLALVYVSTDDALWMEKVDAVCLAVSSMSKFPSLMKKWYDKVLDAERWGVIKSY